MILAAGRAVPCEPALHCAAPSHAATPLHSMMMSHLRHGAMRVVHPMHVLAKHQPLHKPPMPNVSTGGANPKFSVSIGHCWHARVAACAQCPQQRLHCLKGRATTVFSWMKSGDCIRRVAYSRKGTCPLQHPGRTQLVCRCIALTLPVACDQKAKAGRLELYSTTDN